MKDEWTDILTKALPLKAFKELQPTSSEDLLELEGEGGCWTIKRTVKVVVDWRKLLNLSRVKVNLSNHCRPLQVGKW